MTVMIIARMEFQMKKINKVPILTAMLISISGTSILAVTGTVNAPSGLVLREEASKGGSVITTVQDDEPVEVLEKNGEWYKVKYNGQEGYLFAEYVETEENNIPNGEQTPTTLPSENEPTMQNPETPENESNGETNPEQNPSTEPPFITEPKVVQAKTSANIYIMPLISSTPVGSITVGSTITITKQITNWSYITTGTVEGWVRTYLIKNEVTRSTTNRGKWICK